ncbi:DedA family protein [Bacillus sp. J14TS2]|uniref:TVP38/TMEM64 family protein n=1 Tax=Bacillus sp. J14TS2 TaxID=2807188 RepID=UPI001B264893|nr:VTT domain-containing protein [Bacillus sp. J14TS2]GIN71315.1 DedA family protein [Bacillus sp. J14TS2]
MNEQLVIMLTFVQGTGTLAPIIFIFFHVIRQFIFIPVIMVCMVGGILFGSVLGTVFSMTGLLILSALFYFCIRKMPSTYEKLLKIKNKWFGRYAKMTVGQIAILRLIPFFHYHLLNLCLLERRPDFKGFMRGAFATNLPLAFFYTVFGEFITHFTPTISVIILLALLALVYILREKMSTVAWNEFFSKQQETKNVCS